MVYDFKIVQIYCYLYLFTQTSVLMTVGKKAFVKNCGKRRKYLCLLELLSSDVHNPSPQSQPALMLVSNAFMKKNFTKSLQNYFIKTLLQRYSFRHINNTQLLKTLRANKKLLVTSNFSFSHNVFYSIR